MEAIAFLFRKMPENQTRRRLLGIRIRPITVNVVSCILVIISLTAGSLMYVQTRSSMLRERYLLEEAEREQSRIRMENRTLRLTWATLTSPKILDDMARQRFRLHNPKPQEVVRLP